MVRFLLNNIGKIIIIFLFLGVLGHLPSIIYTIADNGLGEVGQKIKSSFSKYSGQMRSRHLQDISGKRKDVQKREQNRSEIERERSFPDFYIVPHSLSKDKDVKEEPFSGFYAGGKD